MKEKLFEEVIIIKRKKGNPTVIEIDNKTYILRHTNQYQVRSHKKSV